jgi:hypothetical protein
MAAIMDKSKLIINLDPSKLVDIEDWLIENVGQGGRRYSNKDGEVNHWLGSDDWMYYIEEVAEDPHSARVTFVFRRDSDALHFSLKW